MCTGTSWPLFRFLAARSQLDGLCGPPMCDLVLNRTVPGNIFILFVIEQVSIDLCCVPRTVGDRRDMTDVGLAISWEGC